MSVYVRSLINVAQTLDGVALPAWGAQYRNASTSALVAAQTAHTIQMDQVEADAKETSYFYAPATGATITIPDDAEMVMIDPGATIAALTLDMPTKPHDGQRVSVYFDNIVTTLTMGGGTLKAALTAATAAGFATWRYNAGDSTWYRIG